MSCLNLNKRLPNTKKAFKKSATVFRMKLSKIKRSKFFDFLGKIFRRRRTRSQLRHRGRRRSSAWKLRQESSRFVPVYLDELYNEQPAPMNVERVDLVPGTEAGKATEKDPGTADGVACCSATPTAAATITVASPYVSSPCRDRLEEMSGVDLRAEMFIRKFKEEMKQQRRFESSRR